jgi:nicotinamidase-related amidase
MPKFVPALIVIDMQNDFVYGSLPVPGGATIIDTVNKLIALPFKVKIGTRDFHPIGHVSFAKTHNVDVFSKKIIFHPEDKDELIGLEQVLWPVHCVDNTNGAEFVPGLESSKFDSVVHKGTHPRIESYSAFRDIWERGTTELPDILAEKGVTDLYFAGLAGDYCVKYTAIDGLKFGYNVWLVADAIKSISDQELAFAELQKQGIKVTSLKEVEALLAQ